MSERNCCWWETSLLMKFKMYTINKGAASAHLLESKSKENIAAIWAFSKCNGWGPRGRFSWVIRQFWQHREMACHARASILVIFYDFGISYDLPKVIFFWDWSQDMSSSGFPPKNRHLIGWPIWSTNYKPFLVGNHLNSCPDSNLRKKWL